MGLRQTLGFILSHPMNRGRPISALARYASWQVKSRLQDEVIVDWIDGAKLAVRRGMTGATGNVYCGLHEYVDMSFVLDELKPGDLFVDIGANVGTYTVLASKVCGADTIAVEPDPDTARALRRNIDVNGIADKVQVVEAALGAEEGVTPFTIGRDTVNRVASGDDSDVREVPLRTLDDVLEGRVPAIMKIDVEGYEAEVLKAASKTLSHPGLRAIITETLDDDVNTLLMRAGFVHAYYDPNEKAVSANFKMTSNNSLMIRTGAY
jgi:FkbM family methyltransferase